MIANVGMQCLGGNGYINPDLLEPGVSWMGVGDRSFGCWKFSKILEKTLHTIPERCLGADIPQLKSEDVVYDLPGSKQSILDNMLSL